MQQIARQLIRFEWLYLLVFAPLVIQPSPVTAALLLLLPFFWLLRWRALGYLVPPTPLNVSVLVMLIMILVSMFASFEVSVSLPKVVGLVYGVAVFFATTAAAGRSARSFWTGIAVLLAAGVGVTALGILAVRWSQKVPILGAVTTRLPERLVSLPGATQGINPNEIAGVLLWVAPLALALALMLLLKRREFLQNQLQASHIILLVASFLAALTTTGMIVLVQSRSGWLGLAASIAFLVVVFAGRLRRLVIVLGLLALLAAVGAILVLGLERVTGTLISEAAASNPLTTLRGRQEIWQRALYGIQDFPLTGMGMNTFRQVVHVLYPLFLIGPETDIAHAHNHLLQAGLDLGIPGLIAYLAVWIGAAGMLWRAWRRSESLWLRVAAAGLAASLFGYAVFGMLDAVSLGARPGFLFWLLLGLVAALDRLTFPAQSPVVPV